MPSQPPSESDPSAEGSADEAMDRFKGLAKGLFDTPREKLAEAEKRYQEQKRKPK